MRLFGRFRNLKKGIGNEAPKSGAPNIELDEFELNQPRGVDRNLELSAILSVDSPRKYDPCVYKSSIQIVSYYTARTFLYGVLAIFFISSVFTSDYAISAKRTRVSEKETPIINSYKQSKAYKDMIKRRKYLAKKKKARRKAKLASQKIKRKSSKQLQTLSKKRKARRALKKKRFSTARKTFKRSSDFTNKRKRIRQRLGLSRNKMVSSGTTPATSISNSQSEEAPSDAARVDSTANFQIETDLPPDKIEFKEKNGEIIVETDEDVEIIWADDPDDNFTVIDETMNTTATESDDQEEVMAENPEFTDESNTDEDGFDFGYSDSEDTAGENEDSDQNEQEIAIEDIQKAKPAPIVRKRRLKKASNRKKAKKSKANEAVINENASVGTNTENFKDIDDLIDSDLEDDEDGDKPKKKWALVLSADFKPAQHGVENWGMEYLNIGSYRIAPRHKVGYLWAFSHLLERPEATGKFFDYGDPKFSYAYNITDPEAKRHHLLTNMAYAAPLSSASRDRGSLGMAEFRLDYLTSAFNKRLSLGFRPLVRYYIEQFTTDKKNNPVPVFALGHFFTFGFKINDKLSLSGLNFTSFTFKENIGIIEVTDDKGEKSLVDTAIASGGFYTQVSLNYQLLKNLSLGLGYVVQDSVIKKDHYSITPFADAKNAFFLNGTLVF